MGPSAQELLTIRKRILGALIRDVREVAGRTIEEVAEMLGISTGDYHKFESGEHTPTLPQLEVLAYYFNVPLKHFWGTESLSASQNARDIKERVPELLLIRQKIIGARLRQLREQMGMTASQVAEKSNLSTGQIELAERGLLSLPVLALEQIVEAINSRMDALTDGHGAVGNWIKAQDQFDSFAELPPDLRDFIVQPINRSYLDLAVRLSTMQVNQLRSIAEGILEITY